MDLQHMNLFRLSGEKMTWIAERQQVISGNIANANTPGYVSRDLKPLDFDSLIRSRPPVVSQVRTQPDHLAASRQREPYRVHVESKRHVYEMAPDRNGVSLEEQMIRMNESLMQYQLTANITSKTFAMLRTAARGGA